LLIRLGFHYLIARCAAIGVGMVWNYSMSHAFVFKKNEELMDIPPVV
jgi:putative flippase GtrA